MVGAVSTRSASPDSNGDRTRAVRNWLVGLVVVGASVTVSVQLGRIWLQNTRMAASIRNLANVRYGGFQPERLLSAFRSLGTAYQSPNADRYVIMILGDDVGSIATENKWRDALASSIADVDVQLSIVTSTERQATLGDKVCSVARSGCRRYVYGAPRETAIQSGIHTLPLVLAGNDNSLLCTMSGTSSATAIGRCVSRLVSAGSPTTPLVDISPGTPIETGSGGTPPQNVNSSKVR